MAYSENRNSVFNDLIDDVFSFPEFGDTSSGSLMKTDIREKDGKYMLDIELPGYKKEDIKLSLYNGNLTISADHKESQEEKDAKGRVLRQERYSGACSRTWYVGRSIKENDIHASFKDGVLTIEVPSEEKKASEETKYINID